MEQLAWTSQMALGIPALDDAHKEFVEELARLADTPDADFGAAFFLLVAKLETDFAEEEELMENIGFAVLNSHREQHARVLSGLHHVMSCVMGGDIATGRKAIEFLQEWFVFHVSTMDLALAVAMDLAEMQGSMPPTPVLQKNLSRLLNKIRA